MSDKVGRLSPVELRDELSSGASLLLLDVREPMERAFCAIQVTDPCRDLFVPMGQVAARVDEIMEAAQGAPIVVYCHHGVRSMAVARWLAAQGLARVYNLDGGIDAWSVEVDPDTPRY